MQTSRVIRVTPHRARGHRAATFSCDDARVRSSLVFVLAIGACAANEEPAAIDASIAVPDAAMMIGEVEIGTGATKFEPLTEGATVTITRGPQGGGALGGYHVFGAARVRGFRPNSLKVDFTTTSTSGELLGERHSLITFAETADGIATWGVSVIFHDCCRAEGDTPIIMHVEVDEDPGVHGSAELAVRAMGTCYDPFTFESICPH